MATLKIEIAEDNDILATFPYLDGQYIVEEGRDYVVVELGDRDDTTVAQEQYLDTHDSVIRYSVEQ
jgi:hypothetical protein